MIQLVGKYQGIPFEDILKKDLPYCEFMLNLKFVKKENQPLVDWLKEHIDARREIDRLEKISRVQ